MPKILFSKIQVYFKKSMGAPCVSSPCDAIALAHLMPSQTKSYEYPGIYENPDAFDLKRRFIVGYPCLSVAHLDLR